MAGEGLYDAQRSAVGIGQNGLTSVACQDSLEAGGYFVQGFVPGNAGELALPFNAYAPLGVEHAQGRIEPPIVVRYFVAKEPAGEGVIRVALRARAPPLLHRHQDAARIGAVQGTSRLMHPRILFHRSEPPILA